MEESREIFDLSSSHVYEDINVTEDQSEEIEEEEKEPYFGDDFDSYEEIADGIDMEDATLEDFDFDDDCEYDNDDFGNDD